MHLAELIALRASPGAGLLLALTERCPLSCAHCSTNAASGSPQGGAGPFRTLIGTFTPADHPDLIFMSGGEPLLRPGLVTQLAARARSAGTRSGVLSGMFFARAGTVPPVIRRAVASVDHFSASLDAFHEREVSRDAVFAALRVILDLVAGVSLHVTSSNESYLDDLLPGVRRAFGTRVPMLVGRVRPRGRARAFVAEPEPDPVADGGPCEFASWPLVDYDGTVFACGRQSLVRRHRPDHLVLGHAATDSWARLRARLTADPVLRAVRAVGPVATAARAGVASCAGVCETCVALPRSATVSPAVEQVASQLLSRLRPRDLARRWGAGPHAALAELGWEA